MSETKVLVTGKAGFIRTNVVHLLIEQGISVRVLNNLSAGPLENI